MNHNYSSLFIIAILFIIHQTSAQTTAIPDANFEQALIDLGYDSGSPDGQVPTASIETVTYLNIGYDNIQDLTGIEDFTSLDTLNCSWNDLTTLDLSANTQLTHLNCFRNDLSFLNLSTNTQLTYLNCSSNELNSSLNLSACTQLTELECNDNFTMSFLNLSANTQLTSLNCSSNDIGTLDLSANSQLTYLKCDKNNIGSLNLSVNTQLTELNCSWNDLTTLDLSANSQLTEVFCNDNDLTSLYLPNSSQLTYLSCIRNDLSSLDLSASTQLTELNCYTNYLTTLDISANTQLTELNCYGNNLTTLDLFANTQLTDLTCRNNNLTSLNFSTNSQLTHLNCQYNDFAVLDLSANSQLTFLNCFNNNLTSLDLSANTQLTDLHCYSNKLTSLDLSDNTQLKDLYCYSNKLTSLDLSANSQLINLHCYSNKLTSLDLSACTKLKVLGCYDNSLIALDLSQNTLIRKIYLQNNRLVSLILPDYISNITKFFLDLNPELYCVTTTSPEQVDDIGTLSHDEHTHFSTQCNEGGIITGFVFHDENENGIFDPTETGVKGASIHLNNGDFTTTRSDGYFVVSTSDTGAFTMSAQTPQILSCDASTHYTGQVTAPANNSIAVYVQGPDDQSTGHNFGVVYEDPGDCNVFCGHIFEDDNENGIQDQDEPGVRGVTIDVDGATTNYLISDVDGNYCGNAAVGANITLSIEPRINNLGCDGGYEWTQTYPTVSHSITLTQDTTIGNDFGVYNALNFYDVGIYSIRSYCTHPGEQFKVFMDYRSIGTINDTCYLVFNYPSEATYLGGSRSPYFQSAGQIIWKFAPGEVPDWECMDMLFDLDDNLTNGTQLDWSAQIYCGSNASSFSDLCNSNNELHRTIELSGLAAKAALSSELFNSMEIYFEGESQEVVNAEETEVSVVINYRNETQDTVYHLYITDTLPDVFDPVTVSRPFSNFNYDFQITTDNVLIWEIKDAAIPPYHVDPINSYGFVQYNVMMDENLPFGFEIINKATINYNYNGKIETNETVTTIDNVTHLVTEIFATDAPFVIFPNPVGDEMMISFKDEIPAGEMKIEIVNMNGVVIDPQSQDQSGSSLFVNAQAIDHGVYHIQVWSGDQFIGVGRFVK